MHYVMFTYGEKLCPTTCIIVLPCLEQVHPHKPGRFLPSNGTLSLLEGSWSDVYSDKTEEQSDLKWAQVTSTHKVPTHKYQKKHS